MTPYQSAVRSVNGWNLFFFAATGLPVLVLPFYIYHFGISPAALALFLFYAPATALAITIGYHRLFAHVTYKAHPLVQFLLLFFGAAAFEQSALKWASQHRDHHFYVDTDRDPYNIKKGFWYAHIGWLVFWKHWINYDNVRDLQENRLLVHQHRYYLLWAITSGILTPLAIGALAGDPWGVFLMGICLRITFVYHATFCINSICHMLGKTTYDLKTSARDHWFVALLTFGEGYHNFHHRFPSDYRNGIRWYHWDPSKWLIRTLSFFRLARHLKRVSPFRILHARLSAENQKASLEFSKQIARHPLAAQIREAVCLKYAELLGKLAAFETAAAEYQVLFKQGMAHKAEDLKGLKKAAQEKMRERRAQFRSAWQQWNSLKHQHLALLNTCAG